MSFFIILLIVVGIAFIFWMMQSGSKDKKRNPSDSLNNENDIRRIGEGTVISLRGVGDDIEDFDVVVKAKHLYVEDGFEWHELECERGADKVWIEIEEDDDLELSLCMTQLSMQDAGVSVDTLQRIEREDDGQFTVGGIEYGFEDWGEAHFYRNQNRGKSEQFKYWDFESKDGRKYLAIERWGQGEYQVFTSEELRLAQYRII